MRHALITTTLFRSALRFSILTLLLVMLVPQKTKAQKDIIVDSLEKTLSQVHTDRDKLYLLSQLENYYIGSDKAHFLQLAAQSFQIAELSRDRKSIIRVYLDNGNRYLNNQGELASQVQLAKENFEKAEKLAQENGLDGELGYCYLGLARAFRYKGEADKAINFDNLALSLASAGNSDSLKVEAYNSMGDTYRSRNEKLLAFRNYLSALDIAELSKKEDLLKLVYSELGDFYDVLAEYDKSLDYQMKILTIDRKSPDKYNIWWDYNQIADLFSKKKEIDPALAMYEKAIVIADSMQSPFFKPGVYLRIAELYLGNNDAVTGMDYLNKIREMQEYFQKAGPGFFLDEKFGGAYADLGKFDSAYYYFKRAEPGFEQKATPSSRYEFYGQFGRYYKLKGDNNSAITYYLKARNIGQEIKDMNALENCAKNLDTLYGMKGDYKSAYFYNIEYNLYKDSIRSLSREADLLKLEVDNDNKRRERLAKEEEENTLRRHNIQYMGLTIGLVCLFTLLGMLGFFVVHTGTIRALGFFSFIFLFEFIILIADKQIQEWTHEEPWKILLIKVLLAAILLPLHHWLEHKVIHYLTVRRKFAAPARSLWEKVSGKKQNPPIEEA
jgi:tetratricopeptide (TPR) repeat protein